jgi:hypothetical protein
MPDAHVFLLHNGLQLTITGEPGLRTLVNFLKAATVHFKNQRDIQNVKLYTAGSFQARNYAVSHPGDSTGHYLSPAAWTEAVVDAYRKVATLERASPADPPTALGVMLKDETVKVLGLGACPSRDWHAPSPSSQESTL